MNLKLIVILLIALILRISLLHTNPPGFYSDETSYAYNAYSILKTGRDEYGRLFPWYFEAFGDYKLPVTTYSITIFFALFGVSDFTARLPTALYGVLSVYALYLLTKQLLINTKNPDHQHRYRHLPYLAALILAVTPAHIFMSRGIWDIQPALAFVTLGTYFYLRAIHEIGETAIRKTGFWFTLSALSFVLSMYSYNSARVVGPLLVIILTLANAPKLATYLYAQRKLYPKRLLSIALPALLAIIILWPQLRSLDQPAVTQRARYVSVFHHGLVPALLNEAYMLNQGKPVWQTRLIHNKYNYYGREILQNYVTHLTPQFLFLSGDTHEIFRTVNTGFLLIIASPFVLIGLGYLLIKRPPGWWLILTWLIIAPIPSALTIFVPSVSRAQNLVIPFSLLTAYGLYATIIYLKRPRARQSVCAIITFGLIANLIYWAQNYFIKTPLQTAHIWESGFKPMVEYVDQNKDDYNTILVSNAQAPTYIWFAWYLRLDPTTVWQTRVTDFTPDSNGLNTTSHLNGITFTKTIQSDCQSPTSQTLCVAFASELEGQKTIYSSNGRPKFNIIKPTPLPVQ